MGDMIANAIRRLRARVDGMISRAVIGRVNDALKTQRLQITILDDDDIDDDVEHFQPYGLSFTPPAGAECIALSPGGARSGTVAICANVPGKRPTAADTNTGGLYTDGEWRLFIDADGVVHLGQEVGESAIARADLVAAELVKIAATLASVTPAPSVPYTFDPLTQTVGATKGKVT